MEKRVAPGSVREQTNQVSHDHRSRRRPAVRARPDISTIGECCRVGDWACCRWTTVTRGGAECGIGRGDVPPHRIGSRHNRLRSYGHRQGDQAWLACLVAEIPIFSKFTFSLNSDFPARPSPSDRGKPATWRPNSSSVELGGTLIVW